MRLVIILLTSWFSCLAYANFNISPLSQGIESTQKSASYTLENMTTKKAAYEIEVFSRSVERNGKEVRATTKELRVFPSKIILEPKQKKRIKVIYLGKKNITQEKAYRVVFKQSDRNVSESDQGALNAKFNFHTAFYVTPKGAEADVITVLSSSTNGKQLSLSNQGNKHIILQDWQLKLQRDNQETIYGHPLPDINLLANSEIVIPLSNQASAYQTAEILTK